MAAAETEKKPKAKRKTKAAAAAEAAPAAPKAEVAHYQLLGHPIVTEKTSMVVGDKNRVVFQVPRQATKTQIKAAVEAIFNVKVEKVRTLNMMGKVKRARNSIGRTPSFKKAYVTMKEGYTVNIVEGV